MAGDLNGWCRPRPIRVAFLIEDGEHASLTLDGIFSDCYNRWGGRFSLIAPCIDGHIAPAYWPWLEAFDPDIVYSYVPLSRDNILEIYERLCPSIYKYHPIRDGMRDDVFGFRPSYDCATLSSLSVIFRQARHSRPQRKGAPIKILDQWSGATPSKLFGDNFGAYYVCRGAGMFPQDATSAANLMTIVSPEAARRSNLPSDWTIIPDDAAALTEFAERRASSMALSSALFSPRLDIRDHRWSGSFSLVIGDSFADRVLFWNSRLLIPSWLDGDICCFRISLDELGQPELLKPLGELLKHRNFVTSGSGGQSHIAVRSTSLTADELETAKQLIVSTKPWGRVQSLLVTNLDLLVPSKQSLSDARDSNHFERSFLAQSNWTQFSWVPPVAHIPTKMPDHLSDAPARQAFVQGFWSVDVLLNSELPGLRLSRENQWVLPKRWRMAGGFKYSMAGIQGPADIPPMGRRSRDGSLTIYASVDHPIKKVEVPTAFQAMSYALVSDGRRSDPAAVHDRVYPQNKVAWMRPSNEARYLTGVLGMVGGLGFASQILLHPFLVDLFADLGGTPNLPTDKVTSTVNRLRKRGPTNPIFDIREERERGALADMIVKAARTLKKPSDFLDYSEVKEAWKRYRRAYRIANPQPVEPDDPEYWEKYEQESLDNFFIYMRERQIVFQGRRWTCPRCHHRNWVDFSALSPEPECGVCKRKQKTPIDINWLFRPNEFLIESLRDHSVLSVVWVMTALHRRARRSCIFVESTAFGFTESEKPNAEVDLLAVIDGQTIVSEVKSSWESLRTSDIHDLVGISIRLRPDISLLAVMAKGPGPTREIATARETLRLQNIQLEVLTLDQFGLEDDPVLYLTEEA